MELNICKCFLCLIIVIGHSTLISTQAGKGPAPDEDDLENRQGGEAFREIEELFKYRVVNWCVNGNDEDEFYTWPLVQFRPYLQQTRKFQKYDPEFETKEPQDPNPHGEGSGEYAEYEKKRSEAFPPKPAPKIKLEFNSIQCESDDVDVDDPNIDKKYKKQILPVGRSHSDWDIQKLFTEDDIGKQWRYSDNKFELNQRVHLKLIIDGYDPGVEGILIQGNHAPFGLGFPFGQFYDREDTEDMSPCDDCKHNTFVVVPCLSRTDIQTLAPTLGVFHHQLSFIKSDTEYPKSFIEAGRRKEVHFNYKWNSHPCSSASLVEFFVLIVYDFQRRKYEVKRFGPYDLSPWKTVRFDPPTATIPARKAKQILGQPDPICTVASTLNKRKWNDDGYLHKYRTLSHVTDKTKNPPMYFDVCGAKTDKELPAYISQPMFMPSPLFPQCRQPKVEPSPAYCSSADASVAPCFQPKYSMKCHVKSPSSPASAPGKEWEYDHQVLPNNVPRIRTTGLFDTQCISNYSATGLLPHKQCSAWPLEFICAKITDPEDEIFKIAYENSVAQYRDRRRDNTSGEPLDPFFEDTLCLPCSYPPTTTDFPQPEDQIPLFKRTAHSALMLICYNLVLPIAFLIARHYKEIFHTCESKGWRLWLWLHAGICFLGMIIAYAGYAVPTFYEFDNHMTIGYAALVLCGSGLLTGWLRHRRPAINIILQILHSIPCYAGLFCGCYAFFEVPDVSVRAHDMSIVPPIILWSIMILMHIPMLSCDKKIGMHPKRKLIPIYQVRFETQLAPLHRVRKFFLFFYIAFSFVWTYFIMTA